jgi:hypothetical protein
MGTFFIFMTMLVFGILISILLINIQIELKYRNTLLDKQNEILERERK